MSEDIRLSVVIPAYNEQSRLADSLYRIRDYLDEQPFRSELIVVDDGSRDLTAEVARVIDSYSVLIREQAPSSLLLNGVNVGKGFSVARGLLEARGELVLFSDADLSTPIEEVERLMEQVQSGADVVVGSRAAEGARVTERSLARRVLSFGFRWIVRTILDVGVRDTQCGFKLYRREAAQEIVRRQRLHGFGFDVEHLYLARRLGYRVAEVGVRWEDVAGSKVSPIKDSIRMLADVVRVRWLHLGSPKAELGTRSSG